MIDGYAYFYVRPCNKAAEMLDFYQEMGFQEQPPQLWEDSHLLTDGRLKLLLSPFSESRAGLAILTEEPLDKLGARLKQADLLITMHDDHLLLISPGGTAVYVFHQQQELQQKADYQPSLFGDFYEMSVETPDLKKETLFWKSIGLKEGELQGGATWLPLENKHLRLGLYLQGSCPHPFHSPALTFFMADSGARIAALKNRGVSPAVALAEKPGGEVNEAIYADSEGNHVFLFKAWW